MFNFLFGLFFSLPILAQHPPTDMASLADKQVPIPAEKAMTDFKNTAKNIKHDVIRALPVHHNGRLKPIDTLARETMMFLNGSYSRFSVHPVQAYLALANYEGSHFVEVVEIRDVQVRQDLGFLKNKRFYSLADLQSSSLNMIAEPIISKQAQNEKSLSSYDRAILEVVHQLNLVSAVVSGQQIMQSADYTLLDSQSTSQMNMEVQQAINKYFQTLSQSAEIQKQAATELNDLVKSQKTPEIFQHSLKKMDIEVFFNDVQFFFLSAIFSIVFGICFFVPLFKNKISFKITAILFLIPLLLLTVGLTFRVYMTQFAPVTNMYTTMIWVAFGVIVFSFILFALYKNYVIPGIALIASGLVLMLTHQLPLFLSPDLDPIVAVLRNNFWLSTHVTTITISYAAFTIAMVLGNITLVRLLFYKNNDNFIKEYSHYAYRMIQLGCFLLTIGIILGGIWADYSWGRFWGWDPKETWALIADLGFLAIMHARLVGWITPFSLLAWSPVAYLLVIMAWYGVNFILASGLHSYGFSSGGASAIAIFVIVQLILLVAGFVKIRTKLK